MDDLKNIVSDYDDVINTLKNKDDGIHFTNYFIYNINKKFINGLWAVEPMVESELVENIADNEVWKEFEPNLFVSNYGRIKRVIIEKKGYKKEKLRKLSTNGLGYKIIGIRKNGKTNFYSVHRIVANAFLPNPDNLPCINHKSENKTENFVWINKDGSIDLEKSNLEWCTYQYNANYGTANERRGNNISQTRAKAIKQIDFNGNTIKIWPSVREAEKNGFSGRCIYDCCQGKQQKHKGFKWEYLNNNTN